MSDRASCLIDRYLPPSEGFVLESLVATTYNLDFAFLEEDLLPAALGVRAPVSRDRAFRSEVERRLRQCSVTILYDLRACEKPVRTSRRIDPIAIASRKLHSKISLVVWRGPRRTDGGLERRARVLIGSANLTRPGFRENYEIVAALDFGGAGGHSPRLLRAAIDMLRAIAEERMSPQLKLQLEDAEKFADLLGDDRVVDGAPVDLVDADGVLPTLERRWRELSNGAPERVLIASPFWPEGDDAAAPIRALLSRIGAPGRLNLVCASHLLADGKTLRAIMSAQLVRDLSRDLGCPIYVCPAKPRHGTEARAPNDAPTEDDEVEDAPREETPTRHLHAKLIVLSGSEGVILYVGSSNFTRRGLGIAGGNWEAGAVYQLEPRARRAVGMLVAFAADPVEVTSDLHTQEPTSDPEPDVPVFLGDVVATPTSVAVHFREPAPPDLVLLMPQDLGRHLVLARAPITGDTLEIELAISGAVNDALEPISDLGARFAATEVEARWDLTKRARFAVRFDDKQLLPAIVGARAATELELIEYYRRGWDPFGEEGGEPPEPSVDQTTPDACDDDPLDTSQILSYFVRSFIEAIPGIEAELSSALGSRPLLESVLRGPTGIITLARQIAASTDRAPGPGEPRKTPVAVGFQLVEVGGVVRRCRDAAQDPERRADLDGALQVCSEHLDALTTRHPELRTTGFTAYRRRFLETRR